MPSQHKTPLIGWHPPADLGVWLRAQAKQRGVPISVILNEIISEAKAAYDDMESAAAIPERKDA